MDRKNTKEELFRGKRTDGGEWIEGNLLRDGITGKCYIHAEGNSVNESCRVDEPGCLRFFAYEVDPETVCRCTGRCDISGKLMYEGDIFESLQGTQTLTYTLIMKYGVYQAYCPEDKEYMDSVGFYVESEEIPWMQMPVGPMEEYAKVTGNIFDNPELLNQPGCRKKKQSGGKREP